MRALLLVLEGIGLGPEPDASPAGAAGTAGPDGAPRRETVNGGDLPSSGDFLLARRDLELPTLFSLGLGEILKGRVFDPPARKCTGCYGRMRSCAAAMDATTGNWELAGVIGDRPLASFDRLPQELIDAIGTEAGVAFLGNSPGDFSQTLARCGDEHLRTGRPILHVSPDSVVQIAAHESVLPLACLYRICRIARRHGDEARIARVVARPFTGPGDGGPGHWCEAPGRHAYSMVPPRTIFNALSEAGFPVEGIGAASERFARSGITRSHPADGDAETLRRIGQIWRSPEDGMVFASLGDFDTGAGRSSFECARALETFDDWLADFLEEIDSDDLILLAGGPGRHTAASRAAARPGDEIPVLLRYDGRTGPLGIRETFADVAATLAAFFDLDRHRHSPWHVGTPLIPFHRSHAPFIP